MARLMIIDHDIRIKLEIDANEYCVADAIHSWSETKGSICKSLGIKLNDLAPIVKALMQKGIITINEDGRLQTTNKWNENHISPGKKEILKSLSEGY